MEGTVKRAFGLMLGLLTPEAGESPRNVSAPRYDRPMSAAPSEPAPQYPHTQLDGEEAVIVPLAVHRGQTGVAIAISAAFAVYLVANVVLLRRYPRR